PASHDHHGPHRRFVESHGLRSQEADSRRPTGAIDGLSIRAAVVVAHYRAVPADHRGDPQGKSEGPAGSDICCQVTRGEETRDTQAAGRARAVGKAHRKEGKRNSRRKAPPPVSPSLSNQTPNRTASCMILGSP